MTLYKFLDDERLCLQVRRSPLSKNFSACIEDVFLIEGCSGIHFYGYGQTYEEAVRNYLSKIEGKKLEHYASEYLTREVFVPSPLTF
jgi:hypothetical protein